MKTIRLTKGYVAIVDDDIYESLNSVSWYAHITKQGVYAARRDNRKFIYMHRLILNFPESQVDHINGNRLDNRKENLRLATSGENKRNRGPARNNKSGYKGVHWSAVAGKWYVQITVEGETHNIGAFENKADAAKAYNIAAIKFHGKFAKLNKI